MANIFPESEESGISGTIDFEQKEGGILRITGTISGLPSGSHGFHVHEIADTSDNCKAAGPHFNPPPPVSLLKNFIFQLLELIACKR